MDRAEIFEEVFLRKRTLTKPTAPIKKETSRFSELNKPDTLGKKLLSHGLEKYSDVLDRTPNIDERLAATVAKLKNKKKNESLPESKRVTESKPIIKDRKSSKRKRKMDCSWEAVNIIHSTKKFRQDSKIRPTN